MKTGFELWLLGHDPLEAGAGVRELAHLDEEHADVVHDLDAHALVRVGDLGLRVLFVMFLNNRSVSIT